MAERRGKVKGGKWEVLVTEILENYEKQLVADFKGWQRIWEWTLIRESKEARLETMEGEVTKIEDKNRREAI